MRRADQAAGILLLLGGLAYAGVAALQYSYWGANGPGSGFLPVWLGAAMGVLAVILLVSATRARGGGAAWLPGGRGLRRLGLVLGATLAFTVVLKLIGMNLATLLFLVVLLRFERCPWPTTLAVAVGVTALDWAIFVRWLGVPFPEGIFF